MHLFVNRDTRRITSGIGSTTAPELEFVKDTDYPVEITFYSAGAATLLSEGTTVNLVLKSAASLDGTELAVCGTWVRGTSSYTGTLICGSTEFSNLVANGDKPIVLTVAYTDSGTAVTRPVSASALASGAQSFPYQDLLGQMQDAVTAAEAAAEEAASASATKIGYVSAPAALNDFSMFPGGVAPESGVYKAMSALKEYTYTGGWSAWKFVDLMTTEL